MGRPKRAAAAAAEKALKADDTANKTSNKKSKSGLAVGDELPSFELQTDTEATLSSADMVQDNGIVLFCYPKANTGGCTTQAVGLSEKSAELAAAGFKVYGISADKPKAQANWKTKAAITCTLLCDPTHEVLHQLGFTKGAKSITRSHIVVSRGGKVLDVQYGVTPKNSIKEAVAFCLANKAEPLPTDEAADKGEEAAAAAPAEPKDAELDKEQDAAPQPGPADKAEEGTPGDKYETAVAGDGGKADPAAADKSQEAAVMEVDGVPAAAEAEPANEEEKAADEPAAADDGDKSAADKTASEEAKTTAAGEQQTPVELGAEPSAEEPAAAAAAEEPAAKEPAAAEGDHPAAEETDVDDKPAPTATEEAPKETPTEAPAAADAYAAE